MFFIAALCAMALAACCPSNESIIGKWDIVSAYDVSTEGGDRPAMIMFNEEGQMNGNASVNSFFGSYNLDGEKLTFSQVGMTRMMGQSMEIEDAVICAVNSTASVKIDGDKAEVYDAEGNLIMTLSKATEE